jgi:hypothetical protein
VSSVEHRRRTSVESDVHVGSAGSTGSTGGGLEDNQFRLSAAKGKENSTYLRGGQQFVKTLQSPRSPMRLLYSQSTTLRPLHRLSQSSYVVTEQYLSSSHVDPSLQLLVHDVKPQVGSAGELQDCKMSLKWKVGCKLFTYEEVVVVVAVVVVVVVVGVVVGVVVIVVVVFVVVVVVIVGVVVGV